MIREAMELLHTLGKQRAGCMTLHETTESIDKLIRHGDGSTEIKTFDKSPIGRNHSFGTLYGFLEYLNSYHCEIEEESAIVFVEPDAVAADLAYRKYEEQWARLPLEKSPEYKALEMLFKGIGQKQLWKLLITDLDGHLSETLLASISLIQVSAKTENKCEIKMTGASQGSMMSGVKIFFQPKEGAEQREADISLQWAWTGRIWECFDEVCTIDLRLEIDTENSLKFIFHPRKLESVLTQHRNRLVDAMKKELGDRFMVFSGTRGEYIDQHSNAESVFVPIEDGKKR